MRPKKNGVVLDTFVRANDMPYCRVSSDLWGCPDCGMEVFSGMGEPVVPSQVALYESMSKWGEMRKVLV